MKDIDSKLIWEQYESPGRVGGGNVPFPDGRGEMDLFDPKSITAEHLIYPNVLFGWEFEEDNVGEYGESSTYKHFVEPYFAAKRELQEAQMQYHSPDDGMYGANDIVVLMAPLDYKFVKDDTEMVVILSDLAGEIGFYVDSKTAVRLDDQQVNDIVRGTITWKYGNNGEVAKLAVGRELSNKYEELLRDEGDSY